MIGAGGGVTGEERALWRRRAEEHARLRPSLRHAVREDARSFLEYRGEHSVLPTGVGAWLSVARLLWSSDDFLGVVLYRLRSSLLARGVPLAPAIINRMCIAFYNINIDDQIVIREGLCLPHGNVVLAGVSVVGRRATIGPWTTIGCLQGSFLGPILGDDVLIGTQASILGELRIGDGATMRAGSVVTDDVGAGETVAGVPARRVDQAATIVRTATG